MSDVDEFEREIEKEIVDECNIDKEIKKEVEDDDGSSCTDDPVNALPASNDEPVNAGELDFHRQFMLDFAEGMERRSSEFAAKYGRGPVSMVGPCSKTVSVADIALAIRDTLLKCDYSEKHVKKIIGDDLRSDAQLPW